MSMSDLNSLDSLHLEYLSQALDQARLSPPKPTNFRVGCVLVSNESSSASKIISSGYTLELPGNTHAEQCALAKLAASRSVTEESLPSILIPSLNVTLYTTLEPCGKRLSGNTPCVQRIIATRFNNADGGIRKVIFGAKEPGTFVRDSQSCRTLTEAGIEWEYISGLDDEILKVAMEGHESKDTSQSGGGSTQSSSEVKQSESEEKRVTDIDNISPEERRRQEALPRNPKKRMMEVDINNG